MGIESCAIFDPWGIGGISKYSWYLGHYLSVRGVNVGVSTPRKQGWFHAEMQCQAFADAEGGWRGLRGMRLVSRVHEFCDHAKALDADLLLLPFFEYLSPLWARRLRACRGVKLSIVHDPVRDKELGPSWWHRMSVASALKCYDGLVAHTQQQKGVLRGRSWLTIPHGPYHRRADLDRDASGRFRSRWQLQESGETIGLCIGLIRRNKNLHRVIESLNYGGVDRLVIAGKLATGEETYLAHLQERIESLGLQDRVVIRVGYLEDWEWEALIGVAHVAYLVYDPSFQSSSGLEKDLIGRLPMVASPRGATTLDSSPSGGMVHADSYAPRDIARAAEYAGSIKVTPGGTKAREVGDDIWLDNVDRLLEYAWGLDR